MSKYRITYSILHAASTSDAFVEVGYGSSTDESTIGEALYDLESQIQNGLWERPEPTEQERS